MLLKWSTTIVYVPNAQLLFLKHVVKKVEWAYLNNTHIIQQFWSDGR